MKWTTAKKLPVKLCGFPSEWFIGAINFEKTCTGGSSSNEARVYNHTLMPVIHGILLSI